MPMNDRFLPLLGLHNCSYIYIPVYTDVPA